VFVRVHPWLKIQTPIAPIVHPKMNSGKEFPSVLPCGTRPVAPAGFGWAIVPFQSAGGLAQSKTLRAIRVSSVNAPASWTAVALHRYFFGTIAESVFIGVHP